MDVSINNLKPELSLTETYLVKFVVDFKNRLKLDAKSITIVFLKDPELAKMHKEYLNDPSPTDVITFDLGEKEVEGEIYISDERAVEQAQSYNVSVEDEILRLIIHGMLHLAGYDDITGSDRNKMKKAENKFLNFYLQNFPQS